MFSNRYVGGAAMAGALAAGAALWLALVSAPTGGAETPPAWEAPKEAAEVKNPVAADDEKSIAAGKIVYTRQCLACHGAAGKGDGPAAIALKAKPGDLSDPRMWKQTDGALFWKVSEGRGSMPVYKKLLTEEQRWNTVNYIRTLAKKPV